VKRYEREVAIGRPPNVVFEFFADMTQIPRWAPEDFISAERIDGGALGAGSQFRLVTKGAQVASVMTWEIYDRSRELRFSAPRLDVGPGWVEGVGGYLFRPTTNGTVVTAWFQPTLGGLLRLMSPIARIRNVRLLAVQLRRAKSIIEGSPAD